MLAEQLVREFQDAFRKYRNKHGKNLSEFFKEWKPNWREEGTRTRYGTFSCALSTQPEHVKLSIGCSLEQEIPTTGNIPEEAIEEGLGLSFPSMRLRFEYNGISENYEVTDTRYDDKRGRVIAIKRTMRVKIETLCGGKVQSEIGSQFFNAEPPQDPQRPDLSPHSNPAEIEESEIRNLIRLIASASISA